jgi:hypothetical protein
MRHRDLVLSLVLFLAGAATLQFVNIAVLCRGDGKFDGGCGEPWLYVIAEIILLAPSISVGLLIASVGRSRPRRALASVAVVATLLGGVTLEVFEWYSWGAALTLAAVVAALVGVWSLVARTPTPRPKP